MAKKKGKAKSSKTALATVSSNVNPDSDIESINTEAIAAALSSVNKPILMKVCRLCEGKDGPFLNIFDPETLTAKKIQELMPFVVAEYDDLPHKLCFRCSAKVEELHEFVQRCVKTQESLRKAIGRSGPKTQSSKLWEEKLHKSNMSNDDICDALIKKAMAGIEDIPLKTLPLDKEKPHTLKKDNKRQSTVVNYKEDDDDDDDTDADIPLKLVRRISNNSDETSRSSRSKNSEVTAEKVESINIKPVPLETLRNKRIAQESDNKKCMLVQGSATNTDPYQGTNSGKVEDKKILSKSHMPQTSDQNDQEAKVEKPFDIMNHVSMIKVNGVGVLFQCKLCNRNFLKKEVVMSHGCAKNGVPKVDFTKNLVPPEITPKVTTVKYINTRLTPVGAAPSVPSPAPTPPPALESKPKPKIGPASKVRRDAPSVGMVVKPRELTPDPKPISVSGGPSVEFPITPNLKSRYKLVPGPNNTFTLMEDPAEHREIVRPEISIEYKAKTLTQVKPSQVPRELTSLLRTKSPEVIDLDQTSDGEASGSASQPYPVGLFHAVPRSTNAYPTPVTQAVPFTTPAMKKQSYTIVKTGNPSKLLISTKPQPPVEEPPPKKKSKKSKHEDNVKPEVTQPFNVTLEDSAPSKDGNGFFTFINVDPLLQPSYVLPTDNIIQESQISTSTPQGNAANARKDTYSCNMCTETFSREKKLLTHIQSHYSKMDEEDQLREKNTRKRGRRTT